MASDMRIPARSVTRASCLDREMSRLLAGEIPIDEALKNIYAGWEEITDELGRDEQLKLYKASLGIKN